MNNPIPSKSAESITQTSQSSRPDSEFQPPHKKIPTQQIQQMAAIIRSYKEEAFSGPIPPPEILLKYEQACPGAANRIIKMAENQSGHRQKIETKVIESNISHEKTGMNYAFILTVVFMLIGAGLLYFDKPTAGYFALFGPSIFHAGNYIYRKRVEKEEPKKREEEVKNAKKSKFPIRRNA